MARMAVVVRLASHRSLGVTATLHRLHWLPIEYNTNIKMAALAFKVSSAAVPIYLRDLLFVHLVCFIHQSATLQLSMFHITN